MKFSSVVVLCIVSSCNCGMLVLSVQPVAVRGAVFYIGCGFVMFVLGCNRS